MIERESNEESEASVGYKFDSQLLRNTAINALNGKKDKEMVDLKMDELKMREESIIFNLQIQRASDYATEILLNSTRT